MAATRLTFTDLLWDNFEAVCNKLELSLQTCRDISFFYRKKASIEEEYAKNLIALCKTLPSTSGFFSRGPSAIEKESTTLRSAFTSIQEESSKIAGKHLEFSQKIVSDVCGPLDVLVKSKENEKKKLMADGQKLHAVNREAQAHAAKTKEAYFRLAKEHEEAFEMHEKLEKEYQAATDNKKLKANVDKALEKVNQLESKVKAAQTAYSDAVKKANETQTNFLTKDLPNILNQLQEMEESRFETIVAVFRAYQTFQNTISVFIDDRSKVANEAIEKVDLTKDLNEFIEKTKSSKQRPDLLVYEVFKGKLSERESLVFKQTPPLEKSNNNNNNNDNNNKVDTTESTKKVEEKTEEKSTDDKPVVTPSSEVEEKKPDPQKRKEQTFKGLFGDEAATDMFGGSGDSSETNQPPKKEQSSEATKELEKKKEDLFHIDESEAALFQD